jgi:hypothetical protein
MALTRHDLWFHAIHRRLRRHRGLRRDGARRVEPDFVSRDLPATSSFTIGPLDANECPQR